MRILLTGGAGFIGSHLARRLLKQGHTIGVLDYRKDWHNAPNTPGCHWLGMDCRDLPSYLNARDWDFCYHLASTVGVSRVLADPRECIENIVESTRAVLRLGIPGMYFSTSEVYGKNPQPLREDSDCIISGRTRWSYAAAKLCGEWLSLAENWKVVRLFNVIGPNQSSSYGAVVPKFLDAAKRGLAFPIHGDGEQRRTFTSVFDVVEILDRLRELPFDVVNVGSSNTVSIRDLAIMVRDLSGSQSLLNLIPYPAAYPEGFEECPERVPDLAKLKQLIGDFQFRSLIQTLKEILNGQITRYEEHVPAERSAAVSGLSR